MKNAVRSAGHGTRCSCDLRLFSCSSFPRPATPTPPPPLHYGALAASVALSPCRSSAPPSPLLSLATGARLHVSCPSVGVPCAGSHGVSSRSDSFKTEPPRRIFFFLASGPPLRFLVFPSFAGMRHRPSTLRCTLHPGTCLLLLPLLLSPSGALVVSCAAQ